LLLIALVVDKGIDALLPCESLISYEERQRRGSALLADTLTSPQASIHHAGPHAAVLVVGDITIDMLPDSKFQDVWTTFLQG
jgi:hypothetical protein